MFVDRILDLAGDDHRDSRAALARAFQLFLLMHVSARAWFYALRDRTDWSFQVGLAAGVSLCFALAWSRPHARVAVRACAVLLFVKLVHNFPGVSNHYAIELLCIALLAVLDVDDEGERELFLETVRWMTAIVLFYTGLQKVLYGSYFDAQYLGYAIATNPSFAFLFSPLLPPDELARLGDLRPNGVGTGPFSIDAWLVRVISNGVYLVEIAAPAFLLVRRTRAYAVIAAILLTVAIQCGAREVYFGALFVNLLLLFLARAWNQRLLPVFAAFYVVLFLAHLLAPGAVTFN